MDSEFRNATLSIPMRMRAAILEKDAAELAICQIAVPSPEPGEALLRVEACGVCHTDLHVIKGDVTFPRPAVLGHEVSGTIVAFGEGTESEMTVGDSVIAAFIMPCGACRQCQRGRDDLCLAFFSQNRLRGTLYNGRSRVAMPDGSFLAMYSMGGLAEYCVVPVTALAPAPAGIDLASVCLLGCAGLTSYSAVFRAGSVSEGDTVAVIGAGGIGGAVIRMAIAAGAGRVVAVDISADKLNRAASLGATDLVDATESDPVAEVVRLTGGVDVAFEALGRSATFQQATHMLGDGGRMVAIGIARGAESAPVEITPLVRRGHSIIGSYGGRTRKDLPRVAELTSTGFFDTSSMVTERFELADAGRAFGALARGEIVGRAIIQMRS
ncbi:MDR/zinc-dependent alcohol dehydrogenase-like family protein [Humibacter ginsengisoli]